MSKHHLVELVVPALFVFILVIFCDPFMIFMPQGVVLLSLGGLIILYVLFALFIWHESVHDEREAAHRFYASRLAFLIGSAVLTLGVAYEVFYLHHVDPWLLLALGAMVVAKAGASLYATRAQ